MTNSNVMTIEDLNLSDKAINILKTNSFTDIGSLIHFSEDDLLNIVGMGKKSASEIFSKIQIIKEDYINDNNNTSTPIGIYVSKSFLSFAKYVKLHELNFDVRASNLFSNLKISKLEELMNVNLYSVEKLGVTTISHIRNIIRKFISTNFLIDFSNDSINEVFLDLPISRIPFFCSSLYTQFNFSTIREAYDYFLKNLETIKKFDCLESYWRFKGFAKLKEMSSVEINNYIYDFFKEMKLGERELDIFAQRGFGITLETLGGQYNVQRERIRQIDNRTLEKIKDFWNNKNLLDYIGNKNYYCLDQNTTVLDDYLYSLFIRRLDELSDYQKIEVDSGVYSFRNDYIAKQTELFESISKIVSQNRVVEKNELPNLNINPILFSHFCAINNFDETQTKIIKKSTKKEKMASYIKSKTIIDLSKKNIKNIMNEFSTLYDVDVESEKALFGLVTAVSYSIGNSTYTSIDNDPIIDKKTLKMIFSEINEKKFVKADVLFNKYKDQISNTYSPTHLYSFLKKNYSDKYNFGGTNLVIATLDTKASNAERVWDLLNESNGPINRDKIMLKLSLDTLGLNLIDSQNDDIIKWGKGKYYLKSKIVLDDKSRNELEDFLSKSKSFLVLDLLKFSQVKKLSYVSDNHILSSDEMLSFIQNCPATVFSDFIYNTEKRMYEKKKQKIEISSEFEI